MLPQEQQQRYFYNAGAGTTFKSGLPTKSPTPSLTSSSFSNPTVMKQQPGAKEDPYSGVPSKMGKAVKEDPYTSSAPSKKMKEVTESGSIPSIVPKHLPPIKHVEMPITTDSKSLSSSHLGASSREMSLEEEPSSEFIMTGSQKYALTMIYKDAILVEEDEVKYDLHAAVKYGDKELLQDALALANGEDTAVNIKDSNGRTPLDLAALTGQLDLMALLREHGGRFEFKSGARMRAVARRRSEFVTTYLQLVENELD